MTIIVFPLYRLRRRGTKLRVILADCAVCSFHFADVFPLPLCLFTQIAFKYENSQRHTQVKNMNKNHNRITNVDPSIVMFDYMLTNTNTHMHWHSASMNWEREKKKQQFNSKIGADSPALYFPFCVLLLLCNAFLFSNLMPIRSSDAPRKKCRSENKNSVHISLDLSRFMATERNEEPHRA